MYCGEDGMMNSGGMMGMVNMMGGQNIQSGMMQGMMGSSLWGGSWGLWNVIGLLFWIALLVALILLIIWLYKKITRKTIHEGSALEILKKRFARGEVTKKQFEEMKREL